MSKAIEAIGVSKMFRDFTAIDNLSLCINQGEIFGLLGGNGAGKSTTIKILTGLIAPSKGFATVAGYDVLTESNTVRRNIGYMSQRSSLYDDMTAMENITFFAGLHRLKRNAILSESDKIMNSLEMNGYKNTLVRQLDPGLRQKLAFLIATIHQPKVIFLDEPTAAVDPLSRRLFWNLINEFVHKGATVLVTTHHLEESEYCNRIAIMQEGRIKEIGTPSELKKRHQVKSMQDAFTAIVNN